jgi:hypothetical protein
MRVSAGMHDLRSLYVRANACVACHQTLDADLLKAGHPGLVFELDSQSANEPKHWRDDDSWSGARSWLVGQAVALREAAWHSRADSNPAADTLETVLALAWLLQKVTLTEPLLPKIVEPATSDLAPLQIEADDLARRSANWSPTADSLISLLRTLTDTGSEFTISKGRTVDNLFYRARRLVLALDSLTNAVNANRSVPLKLDAELSAIRADVQRHYDFDIANFAGHLRAFRAKL